MLIVRDHTAPVHDERRWREVAFDAAGETTKLLPVRRDEETVAAAQGLLRSFVVLNTAEERVAGGIEGAAGFRDGQRIVGVQRAGTTCQQRFRHGQRGGIAHVVGLLLEGQAQQGDGFAVEIVAGFLAGALDKVDLLKLVDLVHGLQQAGVLSGAAQLVDERLNVLAEAGTAGAVGDVGAPGADAMIGGDAAFQVFHVHVGEGLGQARADSIPERDVG